MHGTHSQRIGGRSSTPTAHHAHLPLTSGHSPHLLLPCRSSAVARIRFGCTPQSCGALPSIRWRVGTAGVHRRAPLPAPPPPPFSQPTRARAAPPGELSLPAAVPAHRGSSKSHFTNGSAAQHSARRSASSPHAAARPCEPQTCLRLPLLGAAPARRPDCSSYRCARRTVADASLLCSSASLRYCSSAEHTWASARRCQALQRRR